MDNTLKFTGRAAVYAKARPNYAAEFIDYLYNDAGMNSTSIIADIGSGTGILSNALLEKGSTVYCVEPNNDMRKTAENNLSDFTNFHSVRGTQCHYVSSFARQHLKEIISNFEGASYEGKNKSIFSMG